MRTSPETFGCPSVCGVLRKKVSMLSVWLFSGPVINLHLRGSCSTFLTAALPSISLLPHTHPPLSHSFIRQREQSEADLLKLDFDSISEISVSLSLSLARSLALSLQAMCSKPACSVGYRRTRTFGKALMISKQLRELLEPARHGDININSMWNTWTGGF